MFNVSPGTQPSVMGASHNFAQVPRADIPRSSFDRSHGWKGTFDSGYLVPVFWDYALPGDTFNVRMSTFARLATPITPVMDNMYLDTFFFAVPFRIVWSNFKRMMGEQPNPGDSTDFLIPISTATAVTGYTVGTLQDCLGLPTGVPGYTHTTLVLRAYNLIYNEWFRDENLQNAATVDLGDGPDTPTNYVLRKRGKRHDYFTSALPWPQKGTAVSIPLGTSAPVTRITNAPAWQFYDVNAQTQPGVIAAVGSDSGSSLVEPGVGQLSMDPKGGLIADLSTATAATINSLRQAFQLQKLYERDARGGTRYTEIIRSHFGVVSPDARQQRPEYLGGGSTPISFTPIPQTSSTDATTPQGNLAAMATHSQNGQGFVKSFTEHTVVIGLVQVRADLNYQQGLNRLWSARARFDLYWPALSHLGEQTVLNKEIYTQGTANPTQDAAAFGYQERFAEYRYKPSQITGQFRSTYSTPLDMWHLAQKFTSLPALNSTFIEESPPVQRVVAVKSPYPEFLCDAYFKFKAVRPMPTWGVPGLIDHF